MKEEQKQAVAKILGYTPYDHQLQALYEAFNPAPTEQEVCEALSEYYDTDVYYENKDFGTAFYTGLKQRDMNGKEYIKKRTIVVLYEGEIGFNASLPPHPITLIGRFYESLEAQDE